MDPFIILVICLSCLIIFSMWNGSYARRKLPPRSTPLPIVGNILQLNTKDISKSISMATKDYDPVFTVYLGMMPTVVLYGFEAIKEALIDQAEEFSSRGSFPVLEEITKKLGLIFSNGERWKQIRHFSLMILQNMGMGKKTIEDKIQEEALCLVKELKPTHLSPCDLAFLLACAPCNVISSIIFQDRFDYGDQKFPTLLKYFHEKLEIVSTSRIQVRSRFSTNGNRAPSPCRQGTCSPAPRAPIPGPEPSPCAAPPGHPVAPPTLELKPPWSSAALKRSPR
ncbi:cytochrome P450 2C21-like, partial [Carlito syrichta]|uniref:Cytochrome P450 2C21-like n=1 Tax=Carlito syrichta TaxID=1868482 RepID=A0A3Q0EAU6_CARSF